MEKKKKSWDPLYHLTPEMARDLMAIESARVFIGQTPIPPNVATEMQLQARIRSTHFSTKIEGNKLTLEQTKNVIQGEKIEFHGRERDTREVQNYWNALLKMEEWAVHQREFSEELIQRVHAIVEKGRTNTLTPYRDGQNAIRDSSTGRLVYLPPESKDVPSLMKALVAWVHQAQKKKIPVPLVAGMAHYQFVTIHPYDDGNGRTARLLATFLLHQGGYGLKGMFSLEEHHARDLEEYYRSLTVHPHPDYYEGRDRADVTPWIGYFIRALTGAFEQTRKEVEERLKEGKIEQRIEPKGLDHRSRVVWALLEEKEIIATPEIARVLGLSGRMVRVLMSQWVKDGWLSVADPSKRRRTYAAAPKFRKS